jgi:hypothetical protein
MTTYFSITSEGGRLGRITWENSQLRIGRTRNPSTRRPYYRQYWGSIQWDHYWPGLDPYQWNLDHVRRLVQSVSREALQSLKVPFYISKEPAPSAVDIENQSQQPEKQP